MSDPAAVVAARARLVAIIAVVVAVAAGAMVVVGFNKLSDDSPVAAASTGRGTVADAAAATTAVAEAGQIAVDFTSFNYKTLTQDQAQIAAHLTPTFKKLYLSQSRPLNAVIRKAKSVAVSRVVASGLSSFDPAAGTAAVLVALDVTSRNVKTPGAVQYYRFSVQLQREGSQWLASNVAQE